MRRLIGPVLFGAVIVAVLLSLEDVPEPPEPFLMTVALGDGTLIVRPTTGRAALGGPSFVIERPDGTAARVRSGRPLAVAALTDETIAILFEGRDGTTVLRWSDDPEQTLEWKLVAHADPSLVPLAAIAAGEGEALVVGRVAGDEAEGAPPTLVWARVREDGMTVGGPLPDVGPLSREVRLVRGEGGIRVVWLETTATGTALASGAVPPDGEMPRRVATAGVRALIGVPGRAEVVVVREGGVADLVSAVDEAIRSRRIGDLPEGERARFAVLPGASPRIVALSSGELLTWPLDGPADGPPARRLRESSDRSWTLLAVGALAAMIIVALIAWTSRGTGFDMPGIVEGRLEYASPFRRLAAWLLDVLLTAPLMLFAVGEIAGVDPTRMGDMPFLAPIGDVRAQIVWSVVQVLVLIYFVVGESLFGQTLGKRALQIRTLRPDGGRVPFGAVVLRNVLRSLVDQNGGALLALVTPMRQRVGDWLARTVVVRMRRVPPALRPSGDDDELRE